MIDDDEFLHPIESISEAPVKKPEPEPEPLSTTISGFTGFPYSNIGSSIGTISAPRKKEVHFHAVPINTAGGGTITSFNGQQYPTDKWLPAIHGVDFYGTTSPQPVPSGMSIATTVFNRVEFKKDTSTHFWCLGVCANMFSYGSCSFTVRFSMTEIDDKIVKIFGCP